MPFTRAHHFCLGFLLVACSNGTSTDTAASAVSDGDGGVSSAASACLETYVSCVRGNGDVEGCRKALHDCARDNGGHEHCDHPDDRRPHHPPPPLPPDGAPPPPPGDGGPPPPPPHPHPHGPPPEILACLDQIDACAKGNDAVATCVANGIACLEAAHR